MKNAILIFITLFNFSCNTEKQSSRSNKDLDIPVAWTTYRQVKSIDEDFQDLKEHGIGAVIIGSFDEAMAEEEARTYLEAARKHDIKLAVRTGNHLLPNGNMVKEAGFDPDYAVMIGGVYEGKAIDRYLFSFTAKPHKITIEPPIYNQKFAYTGRVSDEPIAHYFPEIGDPIRAEIIVPLKEFDGKQHLAIINAAVTKIDGKEFLDNGSVSRDLPDSYEIRERNLYQLEFDLSPYTNALLDKVGVAIYWEYRGSEEWYILDWSNVSMSAKTTRNAVRFKVNKTLTTWTEANGGTFPGDILIGLRFGDEPFYLTGHLRSNSPSVNYPLWDYSTSGIEDYRELASNLDYPRTWGYPEVYGPKSYSYWLYSFHKACAEITGIAREEAKKIAPDILVFRNTTRGSAFSLANDHDGSGPELLARELDIVHLDPYPVGSSGYSSNIPRDMSYYGGLSRRYQKPLIPWMQAHQYGNLTHVTPEHIEKMAQEQWDQGIDAIMWLGYGKRSTFPTTNPDSWEAAGTFHKKLANQLPPKPVSRLAVIRSYNAWALTNRIDERIRNPHDWLMQQWLTVWSIKHGQPYDVFEVAPNLDQASLDSIKALIKSYDHVISNIPFENAWYVGEGIDEQEIPLSKAPEYQDTFEAEIRKRGWL